MVTFHQSDIGVGIDGTFSDFEFELHVAASVGDGNHAFTTQRGIDFGNELALAVGEFGGHSDGGWAIRGEGSAVGRAAGEEEKGEKGGESGKMFHECKDGAKAADFNAGLA